MISQHAAILHDSAVHVETATYTLSVDREQLLVRLHVKSGGLYYHMSMLSAVDRSGETDVTQNIGPVQIEHRGDCSVVSFTHESGLWDEKTTVYECWEHRIECFIRVRGRGALARTYFFRGNYRGSELASIPGFDYFQMGCPNFLEKLYFHASEYASHNAGHESFAWGYALASGPLCYAMTDQFQGPWLCVGLAPSADQWNFQSFEFNHRSPEVVATHDSILGTQAFSIAYHGHEVVSGVWHTPRLVMHIANDRLTAMAAYVNHLRCTGLIDMNPQHLESWWLQPIFCGWHEQMAIGFSTGDGTISRRYLEAGPHAFAACTQANHETWLRHLGEKQCTPGTIIIDAMWQKSADRNEVDTDKWPNMRHFIDACHARGQRVLLWIDLWKHRSLPAEECLTVDGKPAAGDPTNPAYVQRLMREIKQMLSDGPGDLNADGFKVDGQTVQPYGPTMRTHGERYGFALQRVMLELIFRETKRHKPDAVVSLFSANPYFYNVCDMVRLGDLYTVRGDPMATMRHRAEIFQLGMPGKPIDTDGTFQFNLEHSIAELIEEQGRIGIPTLYTAATMLQFRQFAVPIIRPIADKEYAAISLVFDDARRQVDLSAP